LPDQASVQRVVAPWEARRNESHASVDWRFTVHDARTKLDQLYLPQP
jgi:hypothetical protein